MVQRRGKKLGVATGQTMRNWLCVRRKCCPRLNLKDQNVILKSLNFGSDSVLKDYATAVDDGGLETTREDVWIRQELVLYSLNKRKRWLLPDIIAENIADEAFHEERDYRVALVERHLYSRFSSSTVADCKAVHNSRASQKCRKARGNRFSYENDLRISQATVRNRRAELRERRLERARTGRRIEVEGRYPRWDRPHHQGMVAPGEAEIRYEVITPRRKYQFPWNTEKEQNLEDLTSPGWFRWYRRREAELVGHPPVKRKKADLWDDPKWDGKVSNNGYVNEEGEVLFSANDTDECNEYIKRGEDVKTFLGSFITQGRRNKSKNGAGRRKSRLPKRNGEAEFVDCSNTATSHPTMQYGKGSAIYEPKEMFAVETVDSEDEAKHSTSDASDSGFDSDGSLPTNLVEDPVVSWIDLGRIPSDAVLPDSLKRDFANGYVEGMADPRRFSVAVKGSSIGYITAVFTVQEDLSEKPSDAVNLRMRLCNANIPLDELHSAGQGLSCPETDPPSLVPLLQEVQKAVSSLERKGKENCVYPAIVKPGMTWNISQSLMGWTTDFGTTEDVHLQLEAEAVSQESDATVLEDHCTSEGSREDFCGICYESRSAPSCLGGDGGLALLPCQHWFCEECWVQHIVSRVQMTETVIHCPAYKCQTVMDRTTLLSMLPDSLVSLHLARLQDNRISLHKQWKWCPNSRCGRLVKVGVPELGSASGVGLPVLCECGLRWCSLCQKEAHWPASCRQASKHWEALDVKAEEDSERVRSVDVKRCAKCQYPIEKFHGCSHMMCRCGFSFCWECLCAWEEHKWDRADSPCPKNPENLETIWLFHRRRSAAIFSEYAIENRLKVKREVIVQKHRVARALAARMFLNSDCKPSPGLQDDLRVITSGHFRGDGQESLMTWCNSEEEQQRLKELLGEAYNIVIFSVEIRGLLEYLCVLLWKGPMKLRLGQSGWRQMVKRLMFIVAQIEELLDGQQDLHLPPGQIWRRLGLLVRNGLSCVKDIARAMPLVHKRLEGRGQRVKVTKE
ncbi:uncharacterized protein [Diadema antillarum]|uniref:uncharacterized protein n=1 Tax=Diadema antillarum TaxID=105358 RepID=UPI003A89F84E